MELIGEKGTCTKLQRFQDKPIHVVGLLTSAKGYFIICECYCHGSVITVNADQLKLSPSV